MGKATASKKRNPGEKPKLNNMMKRIGPMNNGLTLSENASTQPITRLKEAAKVKEEKDKAKAKGKEEKAVKVRIKAKVKGKATKAKAKAKGSPRQVMISSRRHSRGPSRGRCSSMEAATNAGNGATWPGTARWTSPCCR